ncbi:conserved protein of unknown function [Acetoanaerobium sticklandii]|uniref:Uncharacterized protein n=1 Tax=Acetoanaerobium sticklandii (strain ATCC 12662 / DSM 519 / JCM 1433 / CCUG 9281 / NCIMB 10654 / HF) TaxID=499177 RepID=E3PXG7_ACESD|nr:hypothetical protein [Acetoanaerobium sticklandii]CBH21132.1 conserved protein of unknown function [Acetoanaerobium sticklandii]
MNRDYIIKPMNELISNANHIDRIPLLSFNKMIGNPEKVADFLEIFFNAVNENTPKQTICFKMVEKIAAPEFYSEVIKILSGKCNNIQTQTIFKSTVAIPNDIGIVRESIPIITSKIREVFDAEVMYHGVCLLYRIISKYPELEVDLESNYIIFGKEELDICMKRFEILYMWQTKEHRGKTKPGYIDSIEEFMDFTLKFIKFK